MLTLNDGRSELWQWDTGRKLTVDADCSQVHFSNKVFGRSIDVDVVDGVAIIPDILLQTDKDLTALAFVGTAENGYTKISKVFKVNKRNKPADYVFTPPEQTTLEEIKEKIDYLESIQDPDAIKNAVEDYLEKNPVESPVQSVNGYTGKVELTAEDVGAISQDDLQEATNEALAQAKASGEFNGRDGDDGKDYVLTDADKSEIAEMAAELVDVPDSGGNVDLEGYATEQWVKDQKYLTAVPEGYAKTEDIPAKPEDIGAQPAGNYLTEVPSGYATEEFVKNKIAEAELGGEEVDLSGYAQKSELPTKVSQLENDSGYLTEHQDISGKLDASALPSAINSALAQAKASGEFNGKDGQDYVLTHDDKTEIAEMAADLVEVPDSGGNVDLTGYAKEQWVQQNYQPKGEYLTKVPDGYAKSSEIPKKPEDIGAQPSGDYALKSEIPSVPVHSVNGKTGKVQLSATDVGARPDNWMPSASDVGALPSTTKIPAKTSELTNDSGFITGYTETDPTVPAWAKKATKPSYTASEVGALPSTTKIPSKTSDLTNDSGFITGYTETDPTVPSWAKASSKPSYSKSEVGLGNVDNVKQYSANNPPPYPVTSVNGQTGAVTIDVPAIDAMEPADDDMPKVFLTGDEFSNMTTEKNEVNMEMDYRSKTDSFHAFIAIKYQGSTSLNFAKKNFTVKLFDDEAHATKQKHLFRDWKYEKNKFVLKANWIDHTHARNIVSANLWNEVVASRSDYGTLPEELRTSPKNGAVDGFPVKLYVNGTYQGVYTWNIGKDDWQWGMDEDNTNHALLCVTHNTNGVFKDRAYNFRALWSGVDNEAFEIEVGTNSDALKNGVNAMLSCIINNNGSAFKNNIGKYLDIQSAIDYYIHQYIICGLDGLAKNILLGSYNLTKWYMGAYDMDATFGLWYDGTKFVSTDFKCPEDYQEKFNLLFERLEENYWTEINARYAELRKSVYSVSNMFTHFERFTDKIGSELFAEDLEVFPGIPLGGSNNIKQLRNYIRDRLAYCDEQILIGIPGTAVSLNSTSVAINTSVANTATLVATRTPSNATDDVYWWSDNEAVATVANGVVTAVADGSCTIYAKCGSGYASCSVAVASSSYTNRVPKSIDSSGAVYNGTGYKEGTRLSSSGVEKAANYNTAFGYIPVKGGDTIRFKANGKNGDTVIWADGVSSSNYICVYKSDFTFLYAGNAKSEYGTATFVESMTNDGTISTIKLKEVANVAYMRMSVYDDYSTTGIDGTTAIITVNEEIT